MPFEQHESMPRSGLLTTAVVAGKIALVGGLATATYEILHEKPLYTAGAIVVAFVGGLMSEVAGDCLDESEAI